MPDERTPRLPAVARTCETCEAAFFAKAAVVRKGGGKFCSRTCTAAARGNPPIEKTCPVCSTGFKTWESVNSIFCSLPCKYTGTTISQPVLCLHCGTTFTPRAVGRLEQQAGIRHLYCSRACYEEVRSGESHVGDRFWSKVNKTPTCWLWTATRSREYGQFWKPDGTRILAHRMAWELTHGPIPDGLFVCHNCPGGDNPLCVRPDHLFLGTQADNIRDMTSKGRHPFAKITPEQAREIKALLASGVGPTAIAARFELSRSGVKAIQRGSTWKHI